MCGSLILSLNVADLLICFTKVGTFTDRLLEACLIDFLSVRVNDAVGSVELLQGIVQLCLQYVSHATSYTSSMCV